ncbi:hypothetical protein AB0395_08200 [Streptosporangium sp. NPDC051023]|uniref:hypothetical protein n=1 Tax=Streptosporangium sp. NPDC051023 TaxID=3155410 RepID=UPI00344B81BE
MHITRKTWVSAGIVSAILAGGISVTAAAAARGDRETGIEGSADPVSAVPPGSVSPTPDSQVTETPPTSEQTPPPRDGSVVSRDVNPDPEQVTTYWTKQRLQEANPFPMPEVDDLSEGRVNGTE